MRIRWFEAADAAAVCEIFYRSVHEVACAKYDAAQIDAWAPCVPDPQQWLTRLRDYETFVADDEAGRAVGWIAMSDGGYLDMLYCLPEATRCGIADALYAAVEAAAISRGLVRLSAHASLLAQPFFQRHAWAIDEFETVVRDGIALPRAAMSKSLRAPIVTCADTRDDRSR